MSSQSISKQDIAKSFGKAAESYDSVAHFQRWVGTSLMERMPSCKPRSMVDLGCGTGYFAPALCARFPESAYTGVDLSEQMLSYAKSHHETLHAEWLVGDAENLSFPDRSIDLIYSSLAIQWCDDLPNLFKEIKRVLAPEGVFAFSTLLDGSLGELKSAWANVDQVQQHVNEFPFLHEYQQAADSAEFEIVSLDQVEKVLEYSEVRELTRELKLLGAHNIASDRPKHLTGKARIRAFIEAYEAYRRSDGILPATYQVLFGVVRNSDI